MELEILRYNALERSTLGLFFDVTETRRQLAYTCEDRAQPPGVKVPGETRIPAGRYRLDLRRGSPMAKRYDAKYAEFQHDGMLWLRDVPGFEWVYLHVGNTDKHTDGCPLLGDLADEVNGTVIHSRRCYERVYPQIAPRIASSEPCYLTVTDYDRPRWGV